jgi:sugar phosphate isomerase/epimerase
MRSANCIAVCSWSLRAGGPAELIERLRAAGVMRVQLALDPLRRGGAWAAAPRVLADAGVEVVSGMFACAGEDYSSLESIRRTGGVVPDATWRENWRNIHADAELAGRMGLKLVTFHAGFLPENAGSPECAKLLDRVGRIAAVFAAVGCEIALETGQEDAAALTAFLEKLGRDDVGVNFDPANMILYGKGDPVAAAYTLGRVSSVKCRVSGEETAEDEDEDEEEEEEEEDDDDDREGKLPITNHDDEHDRDAPATPGRGLAGRRSACDARRCLVRQVHVKDAVPTAVAGTWGREAPVGQGAVHWPAFLAALNDIGFVGNFCIEREAGEDRVGDTRNAVRKLAECTGFAG